MPSCPFCEADLAKAIAAVPPAVSKHPYPLRCTTCRYLVKVWPHEAGPVVKALPFDEIVEYVMRHSRQPRQKTGEAG
jgi:hypothetical protein